MVTGREMRKRLDYGLIAPLELSRDEIVARLDAEARRRLDMSAEDLVRAYRRCELTDLGRVADILALASLLDPTDPLFVSI